MRRTCLRLNESKEEAREKELTVRCYHPAGSRLEQTLQAVSILVSLQHRAWLVPCHDELRLAHSNVTLKGWVISWLHTPSSGQSLSYFSFLDGLSGEASHFSYWVNFRAIGRFIFWLMLNWE